MRKVLSVIALFGVWLALAGIAAGSVLAQSTPSIRIVKPGDRRNVETGQVNVIVEISGASLRDGYSWQAQVDGVPQATVRDQLTTTVTMGQPSGPRRIKAVLFDQAGKAVAEHEILVMAAPVESQAPVFNRDWMAPAMGLLVAVVVGLIALGLRLRPRASARQY